MIGVTSLALIGPRGGPIDRSREGSGGRESASDRADASLSIVVSRLWGGIQAAWSIAVAWSGWSVGGASALLIDSALM